MTDRSRGGARLGFAGRLPDLMTTAGGIGHTLPFLISSFICEFAIWRRPSAIIVVMVELGVISYIRHRYMDTPFLQAAFQGDCRWVAGVIFTVDYLIGSS